MSHPNTPTPVAKNKFRRRRKLVDWRLQLGLAGAFAGITALAMVLQFLAFGMRLSIIGARMPDGGAALGELTPTLLRDTVVLSLGFVLPMTVAIGVLLTFRIAGPLYRMKNYLRGIAAGTEEHPCRLRSGDKLVDFCEALNEATEPLRKPSIQAVEDQPRRLSA